MELFKTCTKCFRNQSASNFHKDRSTKDGYYPRCKVCVLTTPHRIDKAKKATYDRQYRSTLGFKKAANQYKVTVEFLENLLKEQNFVCKICKNPETGLNSARTAVKRLSIDHCHTTGVVRGFLCGKCNKGLGCFNDNSKYLQAAIDYLK